MDDEARSQILYRIRNGTPVATAFQLHEFDDTQRMSYLTDHPKFRSQVRQATGHYQTQLLGLIANGEGDWKSSVWLLCNHPDLKAEFGECPPKVQRTVRKSDAARAEAGGGA